MGINICANCAPSHIIIGSIVSLIALNQPWLPAIDKSGQQMKNLKEENGIGNIVLGFLGLSQKI